jgi:dTDP-4-dehydrorhamnose reductase
MKILVTGSNGLLGQKLTDAYLHQAEGENRFQLLASGTGPNRHPVQVGYPYISLDIRDSVQLEQVLKEERPDCLINTAAMTNVDACEQEKEACYELNVKAVQNMAVSCARLGIHLVQLSTDFIFDGLNPPYTEESKPNPLSYYGQSKWDAEQAIRASDCSASILRTVLVYGVVADMSRSNIVLWAKSALEKGQKIRVVQDQWRMPTLAEDLADACLQAARRKANNIFNVAGPRLYSIFELVEQVADFWGLDRNAIESITTGDLHQVAKRPVNTELVLDRARKELDYRPRNLTEGLKLVNRQLQNV